MQNQYNQYNLEASFRNFLLAENVSPITLKNYLSDFRHFAGWMLQSHAGITSDGMLAELITPKVLSAYKERLVSDGLPHASINRRLSTVRKFCSFCISQGWLTVNPAKSMGNVSMDISIDADILSEYKTHLIKKGLNNNEINKLFTDVSQIIN